MATVAEHYETHLAPIYLWMVGGFDAAVARGEAEIRAALSDLSAGAVAVDLGAGFGMHSIPLARRGCFVVALDTSPILLRELQVRADDLPICAVEADLLSFQAHLTSVAQVILCMGDTLTHLPTRTEVETLFMRAAASLASGGRFILSFRDYATPLEGTERFISVKSDTDRILSCFLEYASDRVVVHDVLHERVDSSWQLRVSAYEKLRLSPPWVVDAPLGK